MGDFQARKYLDGVTPGTATASKAVVLDASSKIDTLDITAFKVGGVAVTSTAAELNYLDITTLGTGAASKAVVLDTGDDYTWPATGILTTGVLKDVAGTTLTATNAEINKMCDDSAKIQTITATGAQAITAGKEAVYLNNASTAIASTIADASLHQGLFLIKAGLEPAGGQDHTCTITTGTWNGTNKIATFADIADSLLVYFDGSGNGTILVNTGTVALSG